MTQTYRLPAMKLAEGDVSQEIQLFRTGTFYHSQYGKFEITAEVLKSMQKNFSDKVRGIDIPVNYRHESNNVAAGWMKDVYSKNNGTELWAKVDWTPAGTKVLADKEFKYISPEFAFEYQDNETLKKFGPILLGAGLTNIPTIKNMEPVVLSDYNFAETERQKLEADRDSRSKKYGIEVTQDSSLTPPSGQPPEESKYGDPVNYKFPMDNAVQAGNARVRFKQFATQIYKTDKSRGIVHDRIVKTELELGVRPDYDPKDQLDALLSTDLKTKLTNLKGVKAMDYNSVDVESMNPDQLKALAKELLAKLMDLQKQGQDTQKAMADMQAQKKMSETKASFALMLSEGKVCKAQEESYLAGDMVKFAGLAQPVRLSENGNSGQGSSSPALVDPQDEVIRLATIKFNEKSVLSLDEGVRAVLKEKPELQTKIYG